ncbi:beta-mannanase [Paenibacillus sp. 1011MAR3C5]|uniref:beta-mannanase n=1 Tax=Paenibacillus sp. 1011MAR3C5 TaxID=1675787 RepID=UPI000E6BA860|nr:beta-mannanase [Paenibacillus sp. 1011MAR3C5]RJE89640.1 beta-mannanase [Paenibacillus sp. 1011MAR3C5]
MQYKVAEEGSPLITGLARMIEEDRCTLRWIWPAGVEAVYIGQRLIDDEDVSEEDEIGSLRLYTKAEYKANNGYVCRLDRARMYRFTIYILMEREEGAILLKQRDGENRMEVSAHRAKIYYSVSERSGLFRKHKSIQIEVRTEVALGSDVLCYVKKQGGFPANREDGLMYPFVAPFSAGRNVLPPIEVDKQDHIRLFLADVRKHGHLYELIATT